jgi:hypothetical protein
VVFTYLFGGGNGNEGLGFMSLCFDFQYIGSAALYIPLQVNIFSISFRYQLTSISQTQINTMIGWVLNLIVFSCLYYGNIWRARDFPFLSQLLFKPQSNGTSYEIFNQTTILDDRGYLDPAKLEVEGVPYMAATFASYVLTQNLAITATITHLLLYNWEDLKSAWSFMAPSHLKKLTKASAWRFWEKHEPTEEEILQMDPHYRLMLNYKDAPDWWFGLVFIMAFAIGLICIYEAESGMSWWAFIIALILAAILILFTGAQAGLTGFHVPVQPIVQMIGAYLEPGNPLTNMQVNSF